MIIPDDCMQELNLEAGILSKVVESMVTIHQSVRAASTTFAETVKRHNHVTPKTYLDLIASYKSTMAKQKGSCTELHDRLEAGLEKLIQVARLIF